MAEGTEYDVPSLKIHGNPGTVQGAFCASSHFIPRAMQVL